MQATTTQKKNHIELSDEESEALRYARDIKGFYVHLACFLVFVPIMVITNLLWMPDTLRFIWATLGWGIGVLLHCLNVYEILNFFSTDWERRQVEKRLGRRIRGAAKRLITTKRALHSM